MRGHMCGGHMCGGLFCVVRKKALSRRQLLYTGANNVGEHACVWVSYTRLHTTPTHKPTTPPRHKKNCAVCRHVGCERVGRVPARQDAYVMPRTHATVGNSFTRGPRCHSMSSQIRIALSCGDGGGMALAKRCPRSNGRVILSLIDTPCAPLALQYLLNDSHTDA